MKFYAKNGYFERFLSYLLGFSSVVRLYLFGKPSASVGIQHLFDISKLFFNLVDVEGIQHFKQLSKLFFCVSVLSRRVTKGGASG